MPTARMMVFLRTKKVKGRNYYYIVEAFRDAGKIKQRVLLYIGTIESMLKKIRAAEEILKKKKS